MSLMRLPRFHCYEGGDPGGIGGVGTSGPGSAAGIGGGGSGGGGGYDAPSIAEGLAQVGSQAALDAALSGGAGMPGGNINAGAFGVTPMQGLNRGFQAGSLLGGLPGGLIGALAGLMVGYAQPGGNVAGAAPGRGPGGGGIGVYDRPDGDIVDRTSSSTEGLLSDMLATAGDGPVENQGRPRRENLGFTPDVSHVREMFMKGAEDDYLRSMIFDEGEFTKNLF